MTPRPPIAAYVPLRLPHYVQRGDELFFLLSTRPACHLSVEDTFLYRDIDGDRTVAELANTHADARERLVAWRDMGIIALAPVLESAPAPHLVVVEPHIDDAALSVGGCLLHRRGRCRITILSVVKRSNFTSYLLARRPFLDRLGVEEITRLRVQEAQLACRLLGAEYASLDWDDAPLRFQAGPWSSRTIDRFTVDAFATYPPEVRDIERLARELRDRLTLLAPDELWIPMGLGGHADHRLTRSACLLMLAQAHKPVATSAIRMYEDVPYSNPEQAGRMVRALTRAGNRLSRCSEDVTDVFEEKLQSLSVFASQFKMAVMAAHVRNAAARSDPLSDGRLPERYYTFDVEPRSPHEWELTDDSTGEGARLATDTLDVRRMDGRCIRRVAILARRTGHLGIWKSDLERVLAQFPDQTVRLYLAKEIAWQIDGIVATRLTVTFVGDGLLHWAWIVFREMFKIGTLTIIVAAGAHRQKNRRARALLRLAFSGRTLLFAPKLRDFCAVLEDRPNLSTEGAASSALTRPVCRPWYTSGASSASR